MKCKSNLTMNEMIRSATDCKEWEVDAIEDIMRYDIFRSTLDWQTKEELEEAAVLAYLALKEIEDE